MVKRRIYCYPLIVYAQKYILLMSANLAMSILMQSALMNGGGEVALTDLICYRGPAPLPPILRAAGV